MNGIRHSRRRYDSVDRMGRPTKVYKRRWLAGYDLPLSYRIPTECGEWLASLLMQGNGQYEVMPHDVLNVWRHDSIDTRRVMLVCCLGERQAQRAMQYAERLDSYLIAWHREREGLALVDVSHMTETRPVQGIRLFFPGWRELSAAQHREREHIQYEEEPPVIAATDWLERLKQKSLRKCLQDNLSGV